VFGAPHKAGDQAEAPALFVEVNPFHAETLCDACHRRTRADPRVVLGPAGLLTQDLVGALPVTSGRFFWRRLLTGGLEGRGRRCYLNIHAVFTLYPINRWTVKDNLSIVLTAVAARLAGCHLDASCTKPISFSTRASLPAGVRNGFNASSAGGFVRLFGQLFVLSPEVQRHLDRHGVRTTCLTARDCATSGAPARFERACSARNAARVGWPLSTKHVARVLRCCRFPPASS
jgi:hypothetical protein